MSLHRRFTRRFRVSSYVPMLALISGCGSDSPAPAAGSAMDGSPAAGGGTPVPMPMPMAPGGGGAGAAPLGGSSPAGPAAPPDLPPAPPDPEPDPVPDPADSPPPVGNMTVVVRDYDYSLNLASRAVKVELSLEVLDGGNCFSLPLRADGFAEMLIDGDAVDVEAGEGEVSACGKGWPTGTGIVLTGAGSVAEQTWDNSQVGFLRTQDREGGEYTSMISWVGGCDRFGPCQSDPGRFAAYRFHVQHDPELQVLCSGEISVTEGAETTETKCEFTHDGGPTYSTFGFMASPSWVEAPLGRWGSVEVTLHDFPSANLAAKIDSPIHADFVDFMEQNFGRYPYGDSLRLVAGPTFWQGFEHPGNISISEQLNSGLGLNHVINHEIAHMWAGNQTTLAGTYDFVWKEAMAEYLAFVFQHQNDEAAGLDTAAGWKRFSAGSDFYPVPLEEPPLLNYYGDVYGPGPMIFFRQLEALFSRDEVMAALRMVLGTERTLSIGELKGALEQATGADLTAYFDAWVYGKGAPTHPRFSIEVAASNAGGPSDVDVTVRQEASAQGLYGCAFAVRLLGAEQGQQHDVWFDLGVNGTPELTVAAQPEFAVARTVFDPEHHCLASDARRAPRTSKGPRLNPWVVGERERVRP